jgi:hypothetical protein
MEEPDDSRLLGEVLGPYRNKPRNEKVEFIQGVNHTLVRGSGNRDYTLARLRRDRPDLAARVEAGEPSLAKAASFPYCNL